jgi:hypothetical protein
MPVGRRRGWLAGGRVGFLTDVGGFAGCHDESFALSMMML